MIRPVRKQRVAKPRLALKLPPDVPSVAATERSARAEHAVEPMDNSSSSLTDLDEDTLRRMLEAAYT